MQVELKNWIDENASELMHSNGYDYIKNDIPEGWSFKEIEHYGGGEQGSEYYTVYEFSNVNGESFFARFEGSYQSYEGADFESWRVVTKRNKTVVVYE